MAGRKKGKTEKRTEKLQNQIDQIDNQIEQAFNKSKEYSEKGESGKAVQEQTRWAILTDKRKIMQKELDDLLAEKPLEGDRTVEWSEETAELFLKWLRSESEGYYRYLKLIETNPDVLKIILAVDLNKPFDNFELRRKNE